jgi:hypothetical protein
MKNKRSQPLKCIRIGKFYYYEKSMELAIQR